MGKVEGTSELYVFSGVPPIRLPARVVYSKPMKRTALATLLFVLPAAALALEYRHGDDGYSDAATTSAE